MVLKGLTAKTTTDEALFLKRNVYGVGLAWDNAGSVKVDLDLQALVVDAKGMIIDAVYYNNLRAMNGSIFHLGDGAGDDAGIDESIWVHLKKIHAAVALVIFVIAVHHEKKKKKGEKLHLKDARNGSIILMQDNTGGIIKTFKMEQCSSDVDVVCLMKRHADGTWSFREVNEPALDGSHFLDILEPTIGNLIRAHIKGAPAKQKVAFCMEKGATMHFLADDQLKRVSIGVGGELPRNAAYTVDIDIACVFLGEAGEILGAVDPFSGGALGVEHCGDGDASSSKHGDDETMTLNLALIPKEVMQIFIVLNTATGTFELIESLYVRCIDQDLQELAIFDSIESSTASGLMVARLFRPDKFRWGCQALGRECSGHNWRDAEADLQAVFMESTAPKAEMFKGNLADFQAVQVLPVSEIKEVVQEATIQKDPAETVVIDATEPLPGDGEDKRDSGNAVDAVVSIQLSTTDEPNTQRAPRTTMGVSEVRSTKSIVSKGRLTLGAAKRPKEGEDEDDKEKGQAEDARTEEKLIAAVHEPKSAVQTPAPVQAVEPIVRLALDKEDQMSVAEERDDPAKAAACKCKTGGLGCF